MAAGARKVRVFGDNETMDDLTAEREELAQAEGAPESVPPPPEEPPPAPEPEPEPEKETRANKRIRQLLEERAAISRERDELRERWARYDERSKQVQEARQAAERQAQLQREAAERPDPAIDSVGAELWDTKKALRELTAWRQEQEQRFQELQTGVTADRQTTDFNNWVVAEAQAFTRQQPDYPDAARHAAEWRMSWWQELGMAPEQARQLVMAESNLLARVAQQNGKPFAPAIYKLAQAVGYRGANGVGNGTTSPVVSQAGRILSQAARGQAMQGLGRAPAAGGEAATSYKHMKAADIANMSEQEFSRALADPRTRAELEYAMSLADGIEPGEASYMRR